MKKTSILIALFLSISIFTPAFGAEVVLNGTNVNIINPEFKQQLKEGVFGDDVKRLQMLLSRDFSIYPESLVTGYFGKLTKEAVSRLQARFKLSQTGEVNAETINILNNILNNKININGVANLKLEINVEVRAKESRVEVRYDGNKGKFYIRQTKESSIIKELARRLDLTETQVKEAIKIEDN